MAVIEEIAAERRRQVDVEGWSAEHDDNHDSGQMALAAACYAAGSRLDQPMPAANAGAWDRGRKMLWPWGQEWWKPKDRRSDLIRAAALIVAENRAARPRTATQSHRCIGRATQMQAHHTPGPWKHNCFLVTGPRGEHVTHTGMGNMPPSRSTESEANARLIAAAPELLEALKAVVAIADRKTDEFDRAHAAIAKAEGH